ncbi:MAG: aminodeoxychorismate/anthranilate synthase component II [Candidatus Methanomethylophilaceae archaeon]|nr:aminodeoxychorismate/anthranilate synthase component II [Candidatus Methanomethylophilaceae archaeon]
MILLIDNYDSFSYNLYQMIGSMNPDIAVVRNDAITVEGIRELSPDAIIISPGPGRPEDAGICIDAIRSLGPEVPILGVCLGHQAICAAYGGTITHARKLMHGKQSVVRKAAEDSVLSGLPESFPVARYHSLAVDPDTVPECLQVTAIADDGEVMAVRHRDFPVHGLQFHPESIMTPDGKAMLANFLRDAGLKVVM